MRIINSRELVCPSGYPSMKGGNRDARGGRGRDGVKVRLCLPVFRGWVGVGLSVPVHDADQLADRVIFYLLDQRLAA